jgi:streptomycin 3"-adenylyltransferase
MTPGPDPTALKMATLVATRLGEALGSNLAAIYLHGSAVLGGFDPSVSDLDVLVICEDPLSDAEVDAVATSVEHLDLPAKGLEMSVLTRSEARDPDVGRPRFQIHAAIGQGGAARRVDGRPGGGDRDLILHIAVCRSSGHPLAGPAPEATLPSLSDAIVQQAMIDEIGWARGSGDPVYLVLTAARASEFARTRRLVSKVEAGKADAALPVVRAALARQRGVASPIDPADARRYADEVEARLRSDRTLTDAGLTEARAGRVKR